MIIVVSLGMMAVVATVAAAGLGQVVSGNVFAARDRRFRSFVDLQRLWRGAGGFPQARKPKVLTIELRAFEHSQPALQQIG